jgi:predicted nucleic acid-binding protein
MKVFVDTNILIDLICLREPYAADAKRIFALAYERRIEILMSPLSYINTFYVGRRNKYAAKELVDSLVKVRTFTEVSDFVGTTIDQALASPWEDLEDATQYFCALSVKADCIVTRNVKDFVRSYVPVLTPEEFLKRTTTSEIRRQ